MDQGRDVDLHDVGSFAVGVQAAWAATVSARSPLERLAASSAASWRIRWASSAWRMPVKTTRNLEQARRVAWRLVYNWIDVQLAFVEAG